MVLQENVANIMEMAHLNMSHLKMGVSGGRGRQGEGGGDGGVHLYDIRVHTVYVNINSLLPFQDTFPPQPSLHCTGVSGESTDITQSH